MHYLKHEATAESLIIYLIKHELRKKINVVYRCPRKSELKVYVNGHLHYRLNFDLDKNFITT